MPNAHQVVSPSDPGCPVKLTWASASESLHRLLRLTSPLRAADSIDNANEGGQRETRTHLCAVPAFPKRASAEFQSRHTCCECGVKRSRVWCTGPVPGAMLCGQCWGRQFVCPFCSSEDSAWWYLIDGQDSSVRCCRTCHQNQAQGGSGYRLLEGLCLYPDCDTTYNVWRPWPGRKKAGRVCARHNASLRRDTNDCTRLTAVLDEILRSLPHRSATPLLLKREIAKLVDTRDITARARSGTRRYNKRPTNPKIDKTRRSAWPVPAACLFPAATSLARPVSSQITR